MKSKLTGLILLLSLSMGTAALCVGMVGCASEHHHHHPPPPQVAYDDRDVAMRVRSALSSTQFRYNQVSVECLYGSVRLTGVVPTSGLRADATKIARHVAGVKEVDNRIAVVR